MRLIDANALSEQMETLMRRCKAMHRDKAAEDYNFVLTVLDFAPTVDAAPVVRCKNCKWDRPDILLDKHWCSCFFVEVRADDFCSHGARRADNG